jgi:hypothetical protein
MARIRQQHMSALTLKQGPFQRLFEGMDALAYSRLGETQNAGRTRETAQLSGTGKRFQMGQLLRLHKVYRTTDCQSVQQKRATATSDFHFGQKNTAAAMNSLRRSQANQKSWANDPI